MKNYYFTFGTDHNLLDGTHMDKSWVRVGAEDYGAARKLFVDKFAIPYIGKADKWSFQYEESNFESSYFPKGEYMAINANTKIKSNECTHDYWIPTNSKWQSENQMMCNECGITRD